MGAWDFGPYRLTDTRPRMGVMPSGAPTLDAVRVNRAIAAIQVRLRAQGFDPGRTDGVFGYFTHRAVKGFQADRGLRVDGIAGRSTVEAIFRQRLRRTADYYRVPRWALAGLVAAESGFDPAAVGAFTSPDRGVDRGWVQINSSAHPDVSDVEAFTADVAADWGARRMTDAYERFVADPDAATYRHEDLAWRCAIAHHNSPADAAAWSRTGTPPDEQIETYVARVTAYGDAYWAGRA